MEYTIRKLAMMAGVSTRTLRYYDEIGLLTPKRISSSGYRVYGREEVDQLQQILFYREMGVGLDQIKEIITNPSFDREKALKEHRKALLERKEQLDRLIANVEKTIAEIEGRIKMTDQEKFEGFKKQLVEENERKYGKEIREKYGDEAVDQSNRKMMNLSEDEYAAMTKLQEEILDTLYEAYQTGDPAGELAQKAVDMHRRWLGYTWPEYSKEAHAGLGRMYVEDERFTAYYDQRQPGLAKFLRDAILIYTGEEK